MSFTQTPPTEPLTLAEFAAEVALTAILFNLPAAKALTEGPMFYVAYQNPSGYLSRTKGYATPRTALFHFKLSFIQYFLHHN